MYLELILMAVMLTVAVVGLFALPVGVGWAVRRWIFPRAHPRWLAIGLAVGLVAVSSWWRIASGRFEFEPLWIQVLSLVFKVAFIQSLCRYGIWRADARAIQKRYDLSGVSNSSGREVR